MPTPRRASRRRSPTSASRATTSRAACATAGPARSAWSSRTSPTRSTPRSPAPSRTPPTPGGVLADTVLLDNRGGALAGVTHLIAHGHDRIAFVGDPPSLHTAGERLAGYRQALAERHVPERTELVRAGTHDAAGAERAVRELLGLALARRPTALFCANNRNTVGALRALRDH